MSDTTPNTQTPTIEAPPRRILVAVIAPQLPVRLQFLDHSLEAMQGLVGGLIYKFPVVVNDCSIIGFCNDEFLFNDSLPCRYNPATCQVIHGTFFVCGDSDGEEGREIVSLTRVQVEIVEYLYGRVENRHLLNEI